MKLLQLALFLSITVFYLLGLCHLKTRTSSGIHHLKRSNLIQQQNLNSCLKTQNSVTTSWTKQKTFHLHDSSSSWSHEAASSISSPAAHMHCKCLQHDLQTALNRHTKSDNGLWTVVIIELQFHHIKWIKGFTQSTSWRSPHICCCPWSVSWRTWFYKYNSLHYCGRSLTYESQTSWICWWARANERKHLEGKKKRRVIAAALAVLKSVQMSADSCYWEGGGP